VSVEGVRPPKAGDVIEGKYEILRRIGKGGMAVVYEARSLSLQRPVALKFLHADMAENGKLVERFHREARNAAAITHPCVTYVFDVGWNDDRTLPYMAMELLEGRSLAAVIRATGALSVQRVVHIGSRVLDALEAAHRLGVVHRDLKPENIFLAQQGTQENVKVLDFGISKVIGVDASDTLTKTGTVLGTPAYMSPEQVKCARDVDARADLYALGVVLYEMLAGKPPFEAETFTEIVYKILAEEPPPLLGRRPGLDTRVVDLVHRAMHKEPSRRWPTAESMRSALQEVVVDTHPGEPKPTPLAWELPSPEEMSSAATVAARKAWDLRRAVGPEHRHADAAKPSTSAPVAPAPANARPAAPSSEVRARAESSDVRQEALPAGAPPATIGPVTRPSREAASPARGAGTGPGLYAGPAAAAIPTTLAGGSPRSILVVGVPLVILVGVLAAGLALWLRPGVAPTPAPMTPSAAALPLLPPLARPAAGPTLPAAAPPCRIRVSVATPGATVHLAGEAYTGRVDLPAVCGAHHAVRIEAPGHVAQTLDLVAAVDARQPIELAPLPPPPPTPAPAAAPQARTSQPSARRSSAASSPEAEGGDRPAVNLEANPF
jgi:serine/threonine-protein kinase